MPTPPKEGESQANFFDRCIPVVMKDGTAKNNKQAVAICNSIYQRAKDKSKTKASAPPDQITPSGLIQIKTNFTPSSAAHQPMKYQPND